MQKSTLILTSLFLSSACSPAVEAGDGGGASTDGSTTGPVVTSATTAEPPPTTTSGPTSTTANPSTATTSPPPETDTWSGETSATSIGDDTGYEFIVRPDGGGCGVGLPPGTLAHCSVECSVWYQDCLRGEKCTPWSNDGGPQWNGVLCQPIDPMPDPVGAPCSVEGSGVSGLDSCGADAMCWNVDDDTLEGVCVAWCTGTEKSPVCGPDTTCVLANDGVLSLCLPSCDPLASTCLEGEGCYPSGQSEGAGPFACIRTLDPVIIDDLEHPACAPGAFLATATQNAECGDEPCCTTFCDLTAPLCADTHVCEPYFVEGAGPGASDVGFCRLAD